MEIKVYELNTCGERQIEIRISGELQTSNEKVNLYATYDKDGTMVTCSSGTSMCNNPSYYIDIARFFQKIKDIEGNIAKNAFNMANDIYNKYSDNTSKEYDDLTELNIKIRGIRKQIDEINKKLKRSRKLDTINKLNDELNNLETTKKTLSDVAHEIDKSINEKLSKCLNEIKNITITI